MGNREQDGLSDGKSPINSGGESDLLEDQLVAPSALYIVDSDWRITGLSSDAEEYWRRQKRKVLGAGFWELLPEGEYPCKIMLEKALAERQPIHFIHALPFLDSSVEVNAIPLSGGGLAILLTDISEKKRQDETLAFQAYLLSEISDAVISTDYDLNIISLNKAAEQIYGWKAAEVLGKNADTIFKAEFVGISAAETVYKLRKDGHIEIEVIHRRKDGSKLNVLSKITQLYDKDGRPIGTVGVNRDITELKRQHEILNKSRQHDKMLAELTSRLLECDNIEVILQDICRSVMLYLSFDIFMAFLTDPGNKELRFHSSSGLPESEAEMHRWIAYGRELGDEAAQNKRRIVRGDLGKSRRGAAGTPAPDGLTAYVCYPLISNDKILGAVGFGSKKKAFLTDEELSFISVISNDISIVMSRLAVIRALAESEERAQVLVERLKTADRNKNDFLNSLSHELRNPLATIVAGLSLLEVSDKAKSGEIMEALKSQTGQLCRLVDDLLDLTRMTNNKIILKKERVDIRVLILSSVKAHQALFNEKGVRLETDFEPTPLYVDGDTARLMQIVGNLLQNAHKYTDRGGMVLIRAFREEDRAIIIVRDTGIGIAPEFFTSLFEPFIQGDLTSDRLNSGLGLGLSIVKGIVELHGGTVTAHSDGIGKGASFTIALPLAEGNG